MSLSIEMTAMCGKADNKQMAVMYVKTDNKENYTYFTALLQLLLLLK